MAEKTATTTRPARRPEQARLARRPEQARPEQARPEQARPEQARPVLRERPAAPGLVPSR
jgi:hypothetical protein